LRESRVKETATTNRHALMQPLHLRRDPTLHEKGWRSHLLLGPWTKRQGRRKSRQVAEACAYGTFDDRVWRLTPRAPICEVSWVRNTLALPIVKWLRIELPSEIRNYVPSTKICQKTHCTNLVREKRSRAAPGTLHAKGSHPLLISTQESHLITIYIA